MIKTEIGYNAGHIWRLLSNKEDKMSYDELRLKSELSNRDLDFALGWLAREDKIEFESNGNTLYIFLPVGNIYF